MSATVDANVLLYASDRASPLHAEARELLDTLAEGPELLYFFWPVVMAYLRISTHPAVFPAPLSPEVATRNVGQLLSLPHARTAGETDEFWSIYRAVTSGIPVAGNLVTDAHLAALVRENGVGTLWTHDRDFRKFDGIRVQDPFRR